MFPGMVDILNACVKSEVENSEVTILLVNGSTFFLKVNLVIYLCIYGLFNDTF
jgi:hypothetical protein